MSENVASGVVERSRFFQLALLLLSFAAAPAQAQDCAVPQGPDEVAICGDYAARRTAEAMPGALRFATTVLSRSAAADLGAQQRAWYARLPDECGGSNADITCLRDQLGKRLSVLNRIADNAPQTRRACDAIAALADHGAKALRAANLVGRAGPVNLRNNGHPERVLRLDDSGTAHMPYLADEAHQPVGSVPRDDYFEAARWATEIAVVRVAGHTWEVNWDAGTLDGTAALIAATDGNAVCRFRAEWQPPTVMVLPGGERRDARIYHDLLLGFGLPPPSAELDRGAVRDASDLGWDLGVHPSSPTWRVDLMGTGQPATFIQVELSSGAGRGCSRNMLGLVQDGRVTALGLLDMGMLIKPITPLSPALNRLIRPLDCAGLVETPVLDEMERAYVLVDNTARSPGVVDRVRLLAGARGGIMQTLARLSWQVRNRIVFSWNQ